MDINITVPDKYAPGVGFMLNKFNVARQATVDKISGFNEMNQLQENPEPPQDVPFPYQFSTGQYLSYELALRAERWERERQKIEDAQRADVYWKIDDQGQRAVKALVTNWETLSDQDKINLRNILLK